MDKNKLVIILIFVLLIILLALGAIFARNRLLYQKSTEKLQLLNDYSQGGDHPAPDSNDSHR